MLAPSGIRQSFDCMGSCLTKKNCQYIAAIVALAVGSFIALAGLAIMIQGSIYGLTGHIIIQAFPVSEKVGALASFFLGGGGFVGGVALVCSGGRTLL